jgi:endonuclease IV
MIGPHVNRYYHLDDTSSKNDSEGKKISITQHVKRAMAEAKSFGYNVNFFQIFISGPQKLKLLLSDEEIIELREFITDKIKIIAHSAFAAYPWTGMPYPAIFIKKELKVCKKAGLHGLVVHLGKQDIPEVMKNISNLMIKNCPLIYLETPALKPENSHYVKPKDIGLLFKSIRKIDPNLKYFGLCIDSAHLWTSGIDIRSYENAAAWLDEMMKQGIPAKNIIIHLNDSKTPMGSGIDQHEMLMEGLIWKEYIDSPKASGLYAFLDFSHKYQMHIVLERRIRDELIHDYCLLKSI